MTEFELTLFASMVQLMPELLHAHSYGIYELAEEFSKKLGEPVNEILTPFSATLRTLSEDGKVVYDRANNQVMLA